MAIKNKTDLLSTLYAKITTPLLKQNTAQRVLDILTDIIDSSLNTIDNNGSASGITAYATGGQTNATALTKAKNRIDTCATNGDSCKVLLAVSNGYQLIHNNTSNEVYLYPQTGEKFLGLSANAYIIIYPGEIKEIHCYDDGEWTY